MIEWEVLARDWPYIRAVWVATAVAVGFMYLEFKFNGGELWRRRRKSALKQAVK